MLRTSVQIRYLVRVSLFLDLVLVQQRHYTRGVVENRRPLPTVREMDRKSSSLTVNPTSLTGTTTKSS